MNNLPTTAQTGFAALSQEQQTAHRAKIGVRVSAILSQFWVEQGRDEAIETLENEGWQDVLENCSHSEIRAAWAGYQKTGPRTQNGKLCKPDAGALYKIILGARPKPVLVKTLEPEREPRVTPEAAKRILAEGGFGHIPTLQGISHGMKPKPLQSTTQTQRNAKQEVGL